jgi:hypothetical protein
MNMSVESSISGAQLKSLRLAACLEPGVLARRMSLSLAQILQLENDQTSLFYNAGIRHQAARKVYLYLGGDAALLRVGPDHPPEPVKAELARTPVSQAEPPQRAVLSFSLASNPVAEPDEPPPSAVFSTGYQRLFWAVAVTSVVLTALTYVLTVGRWGATGADLSDRYAAAGGGAAISSGRAGLAPAPAQAPEKPVSAPGEPAVDVVDSLVALAPAQAPVPDKPFELAAGQGSQPRCGLSAEPGPIVQAAQARKAGSMVHVQSTAKQVLCVVDASGRARLQTFAAGQSQTFYGQPPWQLQSAGLRDMQVFFQGWRLVLPPDVEDRMQLVESHWP